MDLYTFSTVLGGVGLVAMAASGVSHSGDHSAGHSGGDAGGHAGTHSGHGDAACGGMLGHVPPGQRGHAPAAHTSAGAGSRLLWSLASPRIIFSFLLGFGVTGLLARPLLGNVFLLAAALAGGILFERVLVAPLWNFLFRFASAPALTLESSVMDEASAASGFDANGNGLVALEMDGQVVHCLGTLRDEDRAMHVRVRAGDRLRIEDVDTARNRCTVSYIGPVR